MSFQNAGKPIAYNPDGSISGILKLNVGAIPVILNELKNSRYAIVQVQDNEVRYLVNGSVPNSNFGFLALPNDKIIFEKEELKAGITFISTSEAVAKVFVQFYEH